MAKPPGGGSTARRRPGGARGASYAAVDLGTNNCRLLVAEQAKDGLRVIDSYSQIVRLGEGLSRTGRLAPAAMERAMAALEKCVQKVRSHQPKQSRFIATQACRAAENGAEFLDAVESRLGVRMETISTKDEAKYGLLGSIDLIDPSHDFALVVDIGGGSTELSWVDSRAVRDRGLQGCARRPPILGWTSLPIGVVTLAESWEDETEGWYDRLVAQVRDRFAAEDGASRFGPLFAAGRGHLVGNSGTVTSLAGVHLGLERYQRSAVDGAWLTREEADRARGKLLSQTLEERAAEPCIGPQRADLVLAGCAILDAIWSLWPSERLRVGDRGLREGILLSMMHAGPAPAGKRRRRNRRPGGPAIPGAAT